MNGFPVNLGDPGNLLFRVSTHPPLTCVILVLFVAQHQTSAAVTTSPATTDTTASTSTYTGLQSSIPGN